MTIYIGSSNQSTFGIGTLLHWKDEQIIGVYWLKSEGEFVVVETDSTIYTCYTVLRVETSLGGECEVTDLFPIDFE